MSLNIWRRHQKDCPHRSKGRAWLKCQCPLWADGMIDGKRKREPLKTRNLTEAGRKVAELEARLTEKRERKTVQAAIDAYVPHLSIEASTFKKYSRWLDFMSEYLAAARIEFVDQVKLETLDGYKLARQKTVSVLAWSKELQFFRQFFEFCKARKWIDENPGKMMKMPRDPQPRHRKPYTKDEIQRILAASMEFGRTPYERLRARAMVLLLRTYALRVSDVATLAKDRVRWNAAAGEWEIFHHAVKNDEPLWMPLYQHVKEALDLVPLPRGAAADCPYYFWSGEGEREYQVVKVERTLKQVFAKSGVEGAVSHRFRHTLAIELLEKGRTIEDVAFILGDDPATVRLHYIKFSLDYRTRLRESLNAVHGASNDTFMAREEKVPVSGGVAGVNLVAKVGVEPTRTVKYARF